MQCSHISVSILWARLMNLALSCPARPLLRTCGRLGLTCKPLKIRLPDLAVDVSKAGPLGAGRTPLSETLVLLPWLQSVPGFPGMMQVTSRGLHIPYYTTCHPRAYPSLYTLIGSFPSRACSFPVGPLHNLAGILHSRGFCILLDERRRELAIRHRMPMAGVHF